MNRWVEIFVFICMVTLFFVQSVALFHVVEQRDYLLNTLIINRR